jgi:cobalt-zinc-cadmium efflux system outer membrane protein
MPSSTKLSVLAGALAFLTLSWPASAAPLALAAALAEARTSAPDLAVAKARVKVASAGFASANKLVATNPTLSFGYSTGAPFGSAGDRTLSFGLSQTIEIGGQQGLRRDAVAGEEAGGEAEGRRVRNELLADVVVAFYGLDTARRTVRWQADIVGVYEELLAVAQAALEKGGGTKLDVLTLQMELSRVRGDLATSRGLAGALEAELGGLLGRTGAVAIEPTVDEVPAVGAFDVDALVKKALEERPELAAARARQRLYRVEGSLARREAWLSPTFGLGLENDRMAFGLGGFQLGAGGVPGLLGIDERRTALVLTFSIPLPIFDARSRDVARSEAGFDLAVSEERAARVKVEAEVRAAAAQCKGAGEGLQLLEGARKTTDEAAAAYRESFEKRQIGLGDALLGEERVLRARLSYLAARGSYLRAEALLDRAVGALG